MRILLRNGPNLASLGWRGYLEAIDWLLAAE